MKEKSLGMKLLMAVLALAVLAYFGIQIYRYVNDPLSTTIAYSYQVEESTSATGYVVRDEQVLTGATGGLLRLSRSEGEKVSKGGQVAVVYADQASLDRQTQIDSVKAQIEQLEYAQEASVGSAASLKLDNQIIEKILNLKENLSADRLEAADGQIADLRSLILKRDYTYSDTENAAAKITELEAQLSTLRSQAASSTTTITAPVSGIYSAVVDGYEGVLTPAVMESVTPASLSAVGPDTSVSSPLGKLILGDTWYYAATMSAADAKDLRTGETVTLRFAKVADRDLTVRVKSISADDGGRVAVVFYGRQYLSELTLLRRQSADVIRTSVSGIRVPENAIRVDEDGVTGIYCVVGVVARFKPVEVTYTGDDFALVKSVAQKESSRLRSGDEVIVTAGELYDGMVVGS